MGDYNIESIISTVAESDKKEEKIKKSVRFEDETFIDNLAKFLRRLSHTGLTSGKNNKLFFSSRNDYFAHMLIFLLVWIMILTVMGLSLYGEF